MSSESASSLNPIVTDGRTHTFRAKELPIFLVTVYRDRAELRRVVHVPLAQGQNIVNIKGVSAWIDPDSIQVDGRGEATIQEVQLKHETVKNSVPNLEESSQVKELRLELDEKLAEKQKFDALNRLYKKQLESLEQITETLSKSASLAENVLERTLNNAYLLQEQKCVELSEKLQTNEAVLKKLNSETNAIKAKLEKANAEDEDVQSILITLENDSEASESVVELELSYQVLRASWSPSYDVRVETNNGSEDTKKLKLFYYGSVDQTTGEDWTGVQLVLSTARPTSGGKASKLPKLGILKAQFKRQIFNNPNFRQIQQGALFGGTSTRVSLPQTTTTTFGSAVNPAEVIPPQVPQLKVAEAVAEDKWLSTSFNIPAKKTIQSGSKGHKVTIGVLELDSVILSHCMPSKNQNVFLVARAVNTSDYPLLAGKASVYVNNSFNTRVHLREVGIGEKFDLSLGQHPFIRVEYGRALEHRSQAGVITKHSVVVHEQKIIVRSSRASEPALLTIHEQIPKSTEEKIVVTIVSPELTLKGNESVEVPKAEDSWLTMPEHGARLTDPNNVLEWTVRLEGAEKREMGVKWQVEFPPDEHIEYKEESPSENMPFANTEEANHNFGF